MKVGILLDDLKVTIWVSAVIDFIEKHPNIEIAFIAVNQSKSKGASSSIVYRALRMIDRKLFKATGNPFKKVKLDLKSIDILEIVPQETRFSDRFSDEDVAKIKGYEVDFMLRFGFRILRGDILNSSKYGILSLHHGDTDTYRGGPPAFWEVVNKSPISCVSLQLLTETLDGGIVLDKAFQRTDLTGFYRNQCKLYYAGIELVTNFLTKCVEYNSQEWIETRKNCFPKKIYSDTLYTNPTNGKALNILMNFSLSSLKRIIYQIFYQEQWQLLLMPTSSNWNELTMYRSNRLVPPKDRIWADPFFVEHDTKKYLFFEEFITNKKKAHISFFELDLNYNPTTKEPNIAINESFHLSYPGVFTDANVHYCVPESASNASLTLYQSMAFPFQWKPIKTLFDTSKIYDPTFIKHEGIWFLFCTQKVFSESSSDMYLHIYFTKDLLHEPLQNHPLNPIYRDARIARPAGAIFKDLNNKLVRPVQCCVPRYGHSIQFFEIEELSTVGFSEKVITGINPNWEKNILGTHTFNYTNGLLCGDVQVKRSIFL